jgi:hypothetical protein
MSRVGVKTSILHSGVVIDKDRISPLFYPLYNIAVVTPHIGALVTQPAGSTLENHPEHGLIYSAPATNNPYYFARGRSNELFEGTWESVVALASDTFNYDHPVGGGCIVGYYVTGLIFEGIGNSFSITSDGTQTELTTNGCGLGDVARTDHIQAGLLGEEYSCPPTGSPLLVNSYWDQTSLMCWMPATP